MNRKDFLKKSFIAGASVVAAKAVNHNKTNSNISTYDKMKEQVGFNHLPASSPGIHHSKSSNMKTVLHKAETRGHANHGWLDSHHTFSFASYYNPERMNFGVLRVLNDDVVQGGQGFGSHPHDNMEIISIPLQGDLEHKDSMGNTTVIKQGDVQVMSAGTGVYHSEYNKNQNEEVRFLQIWMFPNKKNVTPRYDQISVNGSAHNKLKQILSPNSEDEGVWAHQNAWFHLGDLDAGTEVSYDIKDKKNGLYAFVLEGSVEIGGQSLDKRDGLGVWDTTTVNIVASKDAKILLMDVPMDLE